MAASHLRKADGVVKNLGFTSLECDTRHRQSQCQFLKGSSGNNLQRFSLIVKRDNLIDAQGKLRVCSSSDIREFHLENIGCKNLYNRSYFATLQLALGEIVNQCHGIKQFDLLLGHYLFLFLT